MARVLVVDDEQVVLDSVRKHLRKEGYEIEAVLSAPAAIAVLEGDGADVVITDLMMPQMDGLQLIEELHRRGMEMPVIMITGYATMRTALQALRKGAFDYIAKPFTRAELQGVVARAVRQAEQRGSAERDAPARDAAGPESFHHLGGHCWVVVDDEGAARIGLEQTFADTVGQIDDLELPQKGDYVEQGSVCLRILTSDGRTHTVWSPVSGTVLELNPAVRSDPDLLTERPYGEGWILRLDPANLEEELKGLE